MSCRALMAPVWFLGVAAGAESKSSLPIACVTGASGYLASEVVYQLLERETHQIRGTVRSLKNEAKLSGLRGMEGASARLELVEADLLDADSFDACVKGAEVVFHTASPFVTSGITDPTLELVRPAVEGTLSVLMAAAKSGTVKRVVLTSSIAAVMGGVNDKDGCFDEDDWNGSSNLSGDGLSQYRYSKLMAERAAWEFVASEAGAGLELSTVCPSFIVGPPRTARVDSESLANMAAVLTGEYPPRGATPMIDVRDAARLHLAAAFNLPSPATPLSPDDPYDTSRRFIASSPRAVTPGDLLRAVSEALPQVAVSPKGVHDALLLGGAEKPARDILCSKTLPKLLESTSEPKLIDPKQSLADMAAAMLDLQAVTPKLKKGAAAASEL